MSRAAEIQHHRDMDAEVDVDDPEDDIIDAQHIDGQTPLKFRFSWRKLWRFVRARRLTLSTRAQLHALSQQAHARRDLAECSCSTLMLRRVPVG